ncbi:formyltetrahydrofolate deformylase [Nitratiruptor sp. YY08-26]|uniref:formyltetrahydrofolate deformylase n=1 Tax=unclassified Nitratiruptor TaxID=2624044 RepID=UPI001916AAB2|nr:MULTISPECIES: formyltetrahydrofolate deformylase [unclassified Nitratiruptor]BCD62042.1 formyltetrahydrofolate deformylase [Nitratiruptor sp. YY08-13]BCD65978.1 formyltetrahydrofolate deformylase [Nitratiruptor sp. YY08-26]
MKTYRVLIDCQDEKGLVYKISKVFFENEFNIEKNDEFVDSENNKFFMRSVVKGKLEKEELQKKLQEVLPKDANIKVIVPQKKKIVIMATKESHVLGDILIRHFDGELAAEIVAVISNYDILRPLVEKFGIDYFHIPHTDLGRSEHEEKILALLEIFEHIDYIVLAKYMRILTPNFVQKYENKIINIHHSFLPAFIGANPYKQAYDRGVKIIGATAHFVNNNLDEGPIIAQDVIPVDHSFSWQQMRKAGRDVEKVVLARALNLAIEDRIFVYANKTVIF